jgi:hypothetical protein
MRLVLLGIMGRTPFAGVAWQVLHYLEGFRRLGCEVAYLEDTGTWPYDPERNELTDDSTFTVAYIERLLGWLGLDAWAYVAPDGEAFGRSRRDVRRLLDQADVLVNLTGATVLREEHLGVPIRIYLETDPGLPQIELAQGNAFTIELLAAHTHHFTFAENLGAPDCGLPEGSFAYQPTRQPVVLEWWQPSEDSAATYTTVASWRQTEKDVEWRGETYLWSKHRQFEAFLDLPRRVRVPLELALACDDAEVIRRLRLAGWRVIDAVSLSRDIFSYRDYIRGSRGEFSVAKDQYVRLKSGWFSDRSACYLAAGKPVVTQDTAFGRVVPTGHGLFAVRTVDEAAAALEAVEKDYARHSRAARELAETRFAAEDVLRNLLERVGT